MSEAAPQAASAPTAEIRQALDYLRLLWGDEFTFGWDPERGFWATRNGSIGSILTAETAKDLARKLEDAEGTGQ